MTAPIDPDQNPHTMQNPGSTERQPFVYDDPTSDPNQQREFEYVPEREFVLMPLFRRIGQLLGIRREEDTEYVYEPETRTPPVASTVGAKAELLDSRDPHLTDTNEVPSFAAESFSHADWESSHEFDFVEQQDSRAFVEQAPSSIEDIHAVGEDGRAGAAIETQSEPEDLLGITPGIGEPVAAQLDPEVALHARAAEPTEPEVFSLAQARIESEPIEPAPAKVAELPQLEVARAQQQSETSDLVASLREATAKISAAITQAAEWLHSKEEEILRRSETQFAQPKPQIEDLRQLENNARMATEPVNEPLDFSAQATPQKSPPQVPKWEVYETPALQREMAWRDQPAGSSEAETTHPNFARSETEIKSEPLPKEGLRPKLVPAPRRRQFWKRVDWVQQFTPKRVAILGATIMAVALVAGISMAKRPASSELPQQTRAIEPGGVTLSTHPSVPAVSPPVPNAVAPQRRTSQVRPARRASGYDDGPEVVTHYYNRKPSPIKQSTVAGGVRHYSDMP